MSGPGPFKSPLTVADIRDGELYGVLVKAPGEAARLSDTVIADKLRAAEDLFEHELQIFWQEQRVASDPEMRPALGAQGTTWDVSQPAFNYPDDFYLDGKFGRTDLNYRPVRAITRGVFAYATAQADSMTPIPAEWFRLDRKFGRFYLLPTAGPAFAFAKFEAFALAMLGWGRGIPHLFVVDYTAGFTRSELQHDHNDLLEALRIETTLLCFGILSNIRTRGLASQSMSQDGQSRSQSPILGKFGPYSAAIELGMENSKRILNSWRNSERGVLCAVA